MKKNVKKQKGNGKLRRGYCAPAFMDVITIQVVNTPEETVL